MDKMIDYSNGLDDHVYAEDCYYCEHLQIWKSFLRHLEHLRDRLLEQLRLQPQVNEETELL